MQNNLMLARDGPVAIVKINRPEVKNALNIQVMEEIEEVFKSLALDKCVNAVVFTGSDEAFCAGFDMNTVMNLGKDKLQKVEIMERSFLSIYRLPVPVIAAVSGPAIAAGFDLMVLSDIRIFSEKALVGQAEIRWALTPLCDPLWKIIGLGRAKELTMSGRLYGADEAKEMGLANFVYPVATYFEQAVKLAHKIASFDRNALIANKQQTNRIPGMATDEAIGVQIANFKNFVGERAMIDRMSDFLGKSKLT